MCFSRGARDYIKYIKRGYTRPAHLASLDIRNKRLNRPEAMELIKQYEGNRPPSLDLFLKFIGLTEQEFLDIAMSHSVSPYRHEPSQEGTGVKTHDFGCCPDFGEMPREEAEMQLERWRRRQNCHTAG